MIERDQYLGELYGFLKRRPKKRKGPVTPEEFKQFVREHNAAYSAGRIRATRSQREQHAGKTKKFRDKSSPGDPDGKRRTR